MKWFISLLLPLIAHAGFSELDSSELYQYETKPDRVAKKSASTVRKSSRMDELTKRLLVEDKRLAELLERQERHLIVRTKSDKITALSRFKGIILNSILATNSRAATFIVRLGSDANYLEGGELRCLGQSFDKRILSKCNLLVLDDAEYEVDIRLWDLDGAEGIISDYTYSGAEKSFLTSSFASFMSGVLDTAKDRIATPFGEVSRNNGKNKVLSGLMGVADNARDRVEASGQENLTVSFANSGKEVLVFFNQSLTLKPEGQ